MPANDSPIIMPGKKFSTDKKQHLANNTAIENFGNIASYGMVPIGGILPFAGVSAPPGYHACDGAALSRNIYAALFSVISTTWGSGDGSTTFNVPTAAQAANLCGNGHVHGGVTAGAANTSAETSAPGGIFIIRTGVN